MPSRAALRVQAPLASRAMKVWTSRVAGAARSAQNRHDRPWQTDFQGMRWPHSGQDRRLQNGLTAGWWRRSP